MRALVVCASFFNADFFCTDKGRERFFREGIIDVCAARGFFIRLCDSVAIPTKKN